MKLTRTITALLLAGLILPIMAACGGEAVTTETTTVTTTEKKPLYPQSFANQGYKGEDLIVRVAYVEQPGGDYVRRSLKADPADDSALNSLILEREQQLKVEWGLELQLDQILTVDGMEAQLEPSLLAGNCPYDLLAGYQYYAMEMASKGYLLDLEKLDEYGLNGYQRGELILERTEWASSYNRAINPLGTQFWITGNLALTYLGGMYCTFVNTQLYGQYLEAEYGSLTTLARNGEWTVDRMIEMIIALYGDGEALTGAIDTKDTYGFGFEKNGMIDALAFGTTSEFTYQDPTGYCSVILNSGNTYRSSQKIHALANLPSSIEYTDADGVNAMRAFTEGKLLFTVNQIGYAERYLSESDDFTILPMPKYDENQKNYITMVHEGCTVFGIPYCTDKLAQTVVALGFLSKYNQGEIMTEYYQRIFKKSMKNYNESRHMLELIYVGATSDFGYAWGRSLNDMGHIFRSCEEIESKDIKHSIAGWKESLDEIFKRFNTFIKPPATN